MSVAVGPRALAAPDGPDRDGRGGGLRAELHGGVRLEDPGLGPEHREPRAIQSLRLRWLSDGRGGVGEGHAPPRGTWRVGLGLQATWGYAPHEPPPPQGPTPWKPQAAGLCQPGEGTTCPEPRLHPEAWAAWSREEVLGEATALELWAGWRAPLEGTVPAFDFELASNRWAPFAPGFGWRLRAGRSVEYARWKARLDGGSTDRYLLGHRLRLDPWPWLSLWVYEIGVVEPAFLRQAPNWVPVWPMYLTQHLNLKGLLPGDDGPDVNNRANLHIGVAVWAHPWAGGPQLAGELFVDDMQQPFKAVTQPDQIALALGAVWPTDPGGSTLRVRYRRTHRYVYTFQNPALSYLHGGVALGGPDGPDSDSLLVLWQRPGPSAFGVEVRRRGPGRLGEVWEGSVSPGEARARQFMAQAPELTVLAHLTWRLDALDLAVALGPVFDVGGQAGRRGLLLELSATSLLL